jgi:hypothetical protein
MNDNSPGVIALRFGLPDAADPNQTNTHYGWAQVYKYSDSSFILSGFGYNDDPNATSTKPVDTRLLISDLNLNGEADPNDWDIFKASWGVDDGGDLDGDTDTTISDFRLFTQSYNLELGAGAFEAMVAAAVPEPTSIMLLAAGAAGFGVWRKRKAV